MGDIFYGKIWKRIIAGLLDYLFVFGVALAFFTLFSRGIVDIGFHNADLKLQTFKEQEKTHLFVISRNSNNEIYGADLISFDKENLNESVEEFKEVISYYYFEYKESEDKSWKEFNTEFFEFDEESLKSDVFSIPSIDSTIDDYVLLDTVIDRNTGEEVSKDDEGYVSAIETYFMSNTDGVYLNALNDFSDTSEAFNNIQAQIQVAERIEIMISTAIATLIVMILPIMLNKNSETMFMHFLKLCYSTRDGYKVHISNKVMRSIVVLILNTISVYLFLIPLLINIIVIFVNKDRRSLIDISSNEICVDKATSTIYENYEEMEKEEKSSAKH